MTTTEQSAGGRVGRARLAPSQLWQVPTFLVGLLAFLAVAASAPIRHPSEYRRFGSAVDALRQGLQQNDPPNTLTALAETVLQQVHDFGDRAAEVHFLAGSVYFRQALASPPELARDYWPRAVEHLEEAQQLGADERDLPMLEYRLGRALYAQESDVPRALELMARSIDRGAEQPLAGYQLLVQAYLKLPVADVDAALVASRKVVELTDDRDTEALALARVNHAELLLRKEQRVDAVKELDRVGARASRPLWLRAKLLQVRLCEQDENWPKALTVWQALLADPAQVPGGKAHVLYAIGWCSAKLEQPDLVRASKSWEGALALGGAEGQAAGLRLGGLRLLGPARDWAQGLEDWRQALAAVATPADYRNPYLKLEEVRELFDQVLVQFQDGQDYEKMQAVAELYRKLAPAGLADEKVAQAAEALAKKMQTETDPPIEELRKIWRRAAEAFRLAAQARHAQEGFEPLWHSAHCFLAARDADDAGKVLLQLEKLNQEDVRLAEGWFSLAEAQRALGDTAAARQSYYRSMQYAATPSAARARYQLALDAVAEKRWDEAAEILQPNLVGPPVDREAHEKSIYEIAWILLQKLDFDRASFYLQQATALYPNNPRALLLRGQLADCYRRFADDAYYKEMEERDAFKGPLTEGQKVQLEEHLAKYKNARSKWLRDAEDTYQGIIDELRTREKRRPLTALETVLGRRAVLSMAQCRFYAGEYLEAVRLYQGLLQRNRATIEGLIACVRIIKIMDFARENDVLTAEGRSAVITAARDALLMARDDLALMDQQGAEFRGDGDVWSWQRWQQWLAAERQRCGEPAVPPARGSLFP